MKFLYFNVILLLGVVITYWATPGASDQICVSSTNEYLACQPEISELNQFVSARSIHSCGEETQQVSTIGNSNSPFLLFILSSISN